MHYLRSKVENSGQSGSQHDSFWELKRVKNDALNSYHSIRCENATLLHKTRRRTPKRVGPPTSKRDKRREMAEEQKAGKTCLVILEAIGVGGDDEKNAMKEADMTYLNSLKTDENCLYYELEANGLRVGPVPSFECRWVSRKASPAMRASALS